MKRPLKKAAAFILTLAFVLQLVFVSTPLTIKADDNSGFIFSVDGTAIYGYTGSDENVVIPKGVTTVYLYSDSVIKHLTIPEGVVELAISSDTVEELNLPSTLKYLTASFSPSLRTIDFSKIDGTLSGNYQIWMMDALETIKYGKISGYLSLEEAPKIKSVDLSKTKLSYVAIGYCDRLEDITFNKNIDGISLYNLPCLKKAEIPQNSSLYISDLDFDAVTVKNNKAGYSVKDGCLYYEEKKDNTKIKSLLRIDYNRETINVEEGTQVIEALELSGKYYKTRVINLPDSVEKIGDYAFAGGDKLEKLSIPKNCISINSYAFSWTNPDTELIIPSSVTYIRGDAFAHFAGKVDIEKETEALTKYEDGIYLKYDTYDNFDPAVYTKLVYYPSDKTKAVFSPDINEIGSTVFYDSKVKSLNIPEGVKYIDLELDNTFNLTSMSIPSTVHYICSLLNAPALTKVTISKDNPYYASYKNCIYDKAMTTLIEVPGALEKVVIPEGVLSLSYYSIYPHWVNTPDGGSRYIEQEVSFPRSLTNFEYFSFRSATCYADSPIAKAIQAMNIEYELDAERYGYEPSLLQYTLKDSNKALLNMIYVIDEVSVKKGSKVTIAAEMPYGLNAVSSLSLGNNTECSVKYSSDNKKIAKINSKTGQITGIKEGTCSIKVKCTIKNNGKKSTKTFTVKVKVK